MEGRRLRLGTRGSALALAQANAVAEALGGAEIVTMRTSGDEASAASDSPAGGPREAAALPPGGDKARFVREIERALMEGEVDLAVHSAKDLPTELPDGLVIAGVPEREDPRDVYVGIGGSPAEIRGGGLVGTSSLRRRAQLLAARPDLEVVELRGNVDTRLRKREEQGLDGAVLAAAGMRRLGREADWSFAFDDGSMTPAAGQGFIAVEARRGDPAADAAAAIGDPGAAARLACERAAVGALDADCDSAVGALATLEGERMTVSGFAGLPDGSEWIRDAVEGDPGDPEALGRELAERMVAAGAAELIERSADFDHPGPN